MKKFCGCKSFPLFPEKYLWLRQSAFTGPEAAYYNWPSYKACSTRLVVQNMQLMFVASVYICTRIKNVSRDRSFVLLQKVRKQGTLKILTGLNFYDLNVRIFSVSCFLTICSSTKDRSLFIF